MILKSLRVEQRDDYKPTYISHLHVCFFLLKSFKPKAPSASEKFR